MRNPMRTLFQLRPNSSASSSASTSTDFTIVPTPPVPAPRLPPGDEPARIPLGQKVTPLDVRDLNELIRKRYALDVEIWSKRDCRPRDRKVILDKMARSDAARAKIMSTVELWDTPEVWESEADWQRLRLIRQRLEGERGQRVWEGNPPWPQ